MPFKKINSFLFNFFHFNKQERNGVFVLCIIISILFLIRIAIPYFGNSVKDVHFFSVKGSSQKFEKVVMPEKKNTEANKNYSNQLFVFNPNTVT